MTSAPRLPFGPLFLLAFAAAAAFCTEWIAAPTGGEAMFPPDSLSAFRLPGGSLARSEIVAVSDMPFRRAMRVTVLGETRQPWDVQILGTTTSDVKAGDVVLLSVFIRGSSPSQETGEAIATAYLQRNSGDYAKVVSMPMTAGPEWKQFTLPVTVERTLGPGQHNFTVFLGYGPQTVEIGGIEMVNYRNMRSVTELPRTKATWAGSEPDAPWRAQAAASIEAIRKADLRIVVVDDLGVPVPDVTVRVAQTRHEFGFGSAVAGDGLNARGEDGDRYRDVTRTWFNKVVLENDLKWPNWEGNRNRAMGALRWLRDNGISMVRGHNLVWPSWGYLPSDVLKLQGSPDALRSRVLNHIDDEVSTVRGWVTEWDVLNEPFTNTDLQKILGDGEMVEWFHRTRAADPDAVLYINDYSILSAGGLDRTHQDGYFSVIRSLIESGAPVGGIGMQAHFGAQLTPVPRVWQILDRFAGFGKDIQITEFDIDTEDEEVQAAWTRDFMTAVFSHPSVSGFMMWGFWEGRHWKPRAAMFRKDWSLKPNGTTFYDLVFRQWWTDVTGVTDADGTLALRAFKGEHTVEVQTANTAIRVPVTLDARGATITIPLPR